MGFFEKLKSGLAKTKSAIVEKIDDIFKSLHKVDEDLFDELEELLISADIGVNTTEELLDELRDTVKKHLEVAVKDKMIKSSLEASVTLKASGAELEFIKSVDNELAAAFIVSEVVIEAADGELQVTVAKAEGEKCERCWCFSKTVGENTDHPTLCARCAGVIE